MDSLVLSIFDELKWRQYDGPIIVPFEPMKHITSGWPKSNRFHNDMDAKEAKTPQTCRLCKQLGPNRHSYPNRETNDRSWCTSWTSYCTVIFFFTSIDLNRFKLYIIDILLNILLVFVC